MEKIRIYMLLFAIITVYSCQSDLANVQFKIFGRVPEHKFRNQCMNAYSFITAVDSSTQDILGRGYLRDQVLLEVAIRDRLNEKMPLATMDSIFATICCDTCSSHLQRDNSLDYRIRMNLQRGNMLIINYLLKYKLKVKHDGSELAQQKVMQWVRALDSVSHAWDGESYTSNQPQWRVLEYQFKNSDNLPLLDSLYQTLCKKCDHCIPSNLKEETIKKKMRFEKILTYTANKENHIVVFDTRLTLFDYKFFFNYTFFSDKDGYLQIHKQLLNPEVFLYKCE